MHFQFGEVPYFRFEFQVEKVTIYLENCIVWIPSK